MHYKRTIKALYSEHSVVRRPFQYEQEAQLSQSDRATHYAIIEILSTTAQQYENNISKGLQ